MFRALVPPGLGGTLEWIAPAGEYTVADPVARVSGEDVCLATQWPVRRPRPVAERLRADVPLRTGQRALDLFFPVTRGGSAAVPGGFGTGKTVLLQQIAKWCDADVIVYVGCGERGNEMADVLEEMADLEDPRSGRPLLDRTVLVANTSNMPVLAREASIYTGVTVAEFYRDMGYDTVLIADSTSRWAEALREVSSRTGELPAEEGYPAGLASALAAFYERSGRVRTLRGRGRFGHHRRCRLSSRWRHDRARRSPHAQVRALRVVARRRPRVRTPLPGRELARLVVAGRRSRRRVAHGEPGATVGGSASARSAPAGRRRPSGVDRTARRRRLAARPRARDDAGGPTAPRQRVAAEQPQRQRRGTAHRRSSRPSSTSCSKCTTVARRSSSEVSRSPGSRRSTSHP